MNWTGKITGLILGLLLGGHFGAILGLILGHFYDAGYFRRWMSSSFFNFRHNSGVQRTFFNATFQIMGYIAKSDGHVSESEIAMARKIMNQMLLNQQLKNEAIHLFNEGKKPDFNLDAVLDDLRLACHQHPSLLRVFLEMQLQMALAETGRLTAESRKILQYICGRLGIIGIDFSRFEERARAEQNYYRHYERAQQSPGRLEDAYRILGVTPNSTDAEVKQAYRRLMSQNHPDKLMSKGLPPEMIKVATRKTQQIKKAYDQIKQTRGMK